MFSLIAWYDGACPLCVREIALMQRLDRAGRINFINVADPAMICPLDRSLLLARFHVSENGQVLSGAAAFAALWRAIPILRPLGLLARNRFILMGLERAYLLFLRIRPRLQSFVGGSA
jgi:predicted DCC family thiol-disulfide oxidoreductase YuxK